MPRSQRFQTLEMRLRELRKHFLPRRFSRTGSYKASQIDLARGYRVLVHAEIEAYIEDRSWQTVLSSIRGWKLDRKPRHVISALLAFCRQTTDPPDSLESAVDLACRTFKYLLEKNNGIKEEDVLRMLQPIGIDRADLDGTWLNSLSSFGTLRGEIAHASVGVHKPVDPQSEFHAVRQLLLGIRDLDDLIERLSG